jgi:peptide deformylase
VEPEKIIIDENFVTNEYEVRLEDPFPPHELVTLTELADLADPSGVEFGTITYDIAAEQVDATDSVSVTAGQQVDEETSIDDTVGVNPNLTTIDEQMQADDAVFVNPNLTTTTDEVQADDAAAVDPNKTTVADDTTTNDTIATEETIVEWDTGSWDDMNWATEHN